MTNQNVWSLVFIAGLIIASLASFIWLAVSLRLLKKHTERKEIIKQETARIFSDDFREELRNRGRVYFEKIINENAMFLKEDLSLTASQLNEHMQSSLKKVLDQEFDKYKQTIVDAKEAALTAITKTRETMEAQRTSMSREVENQVAKEKQRLVETLEARLSHILSTHIVEVLGDEVDLSAQTDYIFNRLEEQKDEIIKDIERET